MKQLISGAFFVLISASVYFPATVLAEGTQSNTVLTLWTEDGPTGGPAVNPESGYHELRDEEVMPWCTSGALDDADSECHNSCVESSGDWQSSEWKDCYCDCLAEDHENKCGADAGGQDCGENSDYCQHSAANMTGQSCDTSTLSSGILSDF